MTLTLSSSKPFVCEYCNTGYVREKTLLVHVCEQKRRALQKSEKRVQLGMIAFNQFYKLSAGAKKDKTYAEFCKSSYYNAFELLFPTTFEKFILSKYDIGQGFNVHQDVSQNSLLSNGEHDRKITITVLLDNNYEGGDFFIHDVGLDAPHLITLQPGDVLLLPSFYEHSMRDITSGQRVSLTTWILGPRWC